jgi:glycosyltransferase involved in cell wall biosynthesis
MSKALELYGIQSLIAIGSGPFDMQGRAWKYWEEQEQKYILYDKSLCSVKRHCNAMRIAGTAAKFYEKHLSEIIHQLSITGVIVYSPQYQLLAPFLSICKRNKVFIIADCGENFSLSFRHLLNGVIYQQFKFRKLQMKKLDGAIISSLRWMSDTKNANIPASIVPGFLDPNDFFRDSASLKSDKLKITIMGRFSGREMPSVIIKALKICKKNELNFEVNIVGSGKGGWMESYWLKKLTRNSYICNDINIRGYVSNIEKDNILSQTDIFIMLRKPSQETQFLYPSRVSEFLFSGNPVILTNTPSLNEFFQQGSGAFFISSKNDSEELARLIMNLANMPLERFECGKKGRAYAMKNFSLKVMGKRLSDFINVINNK